MVLRASRALRPGDRIATGGADHEGVVLRPLRLTALPLRELVPREVARVLPAGPAVPGLRRFVVEFSDGARSQPVAGRSRWDVLGARDA